MLPSRAIGIIVNTSFLIGNWTTRVVLTTGKFGNNFDTKLSGSYTLNMVEGKTIAAVNAVLTTTTSLCHVKVVYL